MAPEPCHPILIEAPGHPAYDELPDESERAALPPRFHVPHWDDSVTEPAWICAVCRGDGWTSLWPCETARNHGGEIFASGYELARYKAALGG